MCILYTYVYIYFHFPLLYTTKSIICIPFHCMPCPFHLQMYLGAQCILVPKATSYYPFFFLFFMTA